MAYQRWVCCRFELAETDTAAGMLAGLLASGVPVYSGWGEPSEGADILNEMRGNGALEDYERGEEYGLRSI